jgi:fucose permease
MFMPDSFPLLATALSSALLAGILLALGAALRRPLAERYGATEPVMRRWAWAFHGLLVPMMLVSGLLIDKWGVEAVLLLATPFCALALSWLGLARTTREAGLAFLALAVGAPGLVLSACVLLPRAFPSYSAVAALNLGLLFLGFGTLLTLRLTDRALERISPRRFLLILALLCLLPAVFALQIPRADPVGGADEAYWERLAGQPAYWLALIALLFAGLLQGSLTSWVGHYLAEVGISASSGELVLLGWWLMLLAGRLLGAVLLRPLFEVWVLLVLTVLVATLIGNLIGTDYAVGGVLGVLIVAVSLGPQVPTLLGVLADPFRGQLGAALGSGFAAASVGQVVFAPRFGPVAPSPSIRVWLRLPMILALLLAAALLTLALVR